MTDSMLLHYLVKFENPQMLQNFHVLLLLYNRQTPCKVLGYHADERVHSRLRQTVLESVQ